METGWVAFLFKSVGGGGTHTKSISLITFFSALIKKSNEAAVSPENAKKMFDLLNETVDR